MMNNIENKQDLNKMSELEFDKNKVEMMRYRPNALSYKLGMGGIAFSVLGAFIGLNSMNPTSWFVIAKILLNVAILLVGFLCIEKTKSYSRKSSIALIVIGGVCAARIFWIPLLILIHYPQYQDAVATGDLSAQAEHSKYLGKTITGSRMQLTYLPENGYFRAITAIIFLVAAALLLIAAGVIGFQKSEKLNKYLASINIKK